MQHEFPFMGFSAIWRIYFSSMLKDTFYEVYAIHFVRLQQTRALLLTRFIGKDCESSILLEM
jgi:hypothetical protein